LRTDGNRTTPQNNKTWSEPTDNLAVAITMGIVPKSYNSAQVIGFLICGTNFASNVMLFTV
jgi:hypothetical protein